MSGVRVIGQSVRVVETPDLAIDELAGNVATREDTLSIAYVTVDKCASEPWLTLHYDEWICVRKGHVCLELNDGGSVDVTAGQTVFVPKGTRFRPHFKMQGTEYIPVCLPAFRPDRCIREEEGESAVASKLASLHDLPPGEEAHPEILYHMCQKDLWEKVKETQEAYFPPTFAKDGFTHATAVPSRLLDTANHFYQDVEGEWLCLRFKRSALLKLGIIVKDERPMAVGNKQSAAAFQNWVCPHVVGGIAPAIVDLEFPMVRDGPRYAGILGLTDMPKYMYKMAKHEEVAAWKESGIISSDLDKKDGFVHLSDSRAAPVVAKHIFGSLPANSTFSLLEIPIESLPKPLKWSVGSGSDAEPGKESMEGSACMLHYILPMGCIHFHGVSGLPFSAVAKQVEVEVLSPGDFKFPTMQQ
mmetsp:Transcript_5615/g.13190  ORF Transcript_5615/g.13190 Transcript_5615/m.13190 type:complete len:414 (+) Transcript_5615:92-1333(+)|eukprot:CAMPEP_0206455922 /NCGR_PEP_ID=MMETSP0324_2-20121206/22060_1 /ASSEMBLY_ACC=CAM_ASM_000836 /TAXON_ID=2866 /ORGANISM="Crypthecodinium cohnii, Strain Seligo" /LENGTH=413 /DNA_ID=CAMNT_0053926757 /DNA_START=56 /DNA_END=1297 /DNA_ORIENTATION=+